VEPIRCGDFSRQRVAGASIGLLLCVCACGAQPASERVDDRQAAASTGSGVSAAWKYGPSTVDGGGHLGNAVVGLGDVNGDGFDDLAVGAPDWEPTIYEPFPGRVHLIYGSTTGPGARIQFIDGSYNEWQYLRPYAAGDVNGDGFADLLLDSIDRSHVTHREWLLLGSKSGISTTPVWHLDFPGIVPTCAGNIGDVTGDGRSDVLCFNDDYSNGKAKRSWWIYAGTSDGLGAAPVWTTLTPNDDMPFTGSAAGIGDFNGDGFVDIGFASLGCPMQLGVLYGTASLPEVKPSFVVNQACGDLKFIGVSALGDVNGDGYSDLAVEMAKDSYVKGNQVAVYFGGAQPASTPAFTVSSPDSSIQDGFGDQVAGPGDLQGDGYADILIGARNFSGEFANNQFFTGRAFVFSGALKPTPYPTWQGYEIAPRAGRFAEVVSIAGDMNGDGFADFGVGDPFAGASAKDNPPLGIAYVYSGLGTASSGTGVLWNMSALQPDSQLPIADQGHSTASNGFDIRATGRGVFGGVFAKLELEIKPASLAFNGQGLVRSADWVWTGTAGANLTLQARALGPDSAYHSRLRLVYRPGSLVGTSHSVWVAGPSVSTGCDASSTDADGDKLCDSADPDDDNDGDPDNVDCAPLNALVHHGAVDVPDDGIDQDCSGAETLTCFEDQDADRWGSALPVLSASGDCKSAHASTLTGDCDDSDSNIHPGAIDLPGDGIDQNCDGSDTPPPMTASGGAGGADSGGSVSAGSSGASSAGRGGAPTVAGDGGARANGGAFEMGGTVATAGARTEHAAAGATAPANTVSASRDPSPGSSGCSCGVSPKSSNHGSLAWLFALSFFQRRWQKRRGSN